MRVTSRLAATAGPSTAVTSRGRIMRRAVAVVLVAVLLAIPVSAAAGSNAEAGDLEGVFTEQLEAVGIPGGAYVTVDASGVISAHGVGRASDGRAITADTPFVIGSTSKSFTALAVIQLVDAGAVDLDAPVRRYVPELELADGEPVEAITVRHLLQHTSGLDDLAGGPHLASAVNGSALDAVAELAGSRLVDAPGAAWRYANANYVLAGLVVERASGSSYADYLEERILLPLGMAATSATYDPLVAPGQQWRFGIPMRAGPVRRDGVMAAGYLASTATDLGRYLAMFLRGGRAEDGTRIVSEDGLRTLLTPGPAAHLGSWAGGATARYAMGWMAGGPWPEPAMFHPGNSPDSSAMIALFPDRGLAVASLVPAGHELPLPGNPFVTDRISSNVLYAALGAPAPPPPSLQRFHLTFDLGVVALLLLAGWSVLRANVALGRRHATRRLAVLLRALPSVAGAAGVLWLPTTSFGWRGLWTWSPDLGVALAGLAVALIGAAALRLLALGPRSPTPAPAPPVRRAGVPTGAG